MQLTDTQRESLQALIKTPWFQVMQDIVAEQETLLLKTFKTMNFEEDKTRASLSNTQNYLSGMEALLKLVTNWAKDPVGKSDDD